MMKLRTGLILGVSVIFFMIATSLRRSWRKETEVGRPSIPEAREPVVASTAATTRIVMPSTQAALKFRYRAPGYVPLIKQAKKKACWAAATAILHGWKAGHQLTVEEVLDNVGPPWRERYNQGETRGLRRTEKDSFLKAAGLSFEYGASYAVEGLENLLIRYGPLWFTVDNESFNTHATVVTGLYGSGSMDDTYIVYIDPADGSEHQKLFSDFMKWYEDVAIRENKELDADPGGTSTIQVVHLPRATTRP